MDLRNIETVKKEAIVKAWIDCHKLIQGGKSFIPELRFFDGDDKINIAVIAEANPNALKDHLEKQETDFAILNQYGFVLDNKIEKKCVISSIYMQNEYSTDYFILFEDEEYKLEEDFFNEVYKIPCTIAKQKLGFVFDTVIGAKITTILPVDVQYSEMCKLVNEAKRSNDWTVFKDNIEDFDLSIMNSSEYSILHELVYNVPYEITKLALDKGADPNITNSRYGRNPAYYANSVKSHQLLIDSGLNINHLDTSGWTAAQYRHDGDDGFEILKLHVDSGLDLSLQSILGRTILFEVISYRGLEIVNYLIEKGADINHQDNWGLTPLFIAAQSEENDIIKTLIKNGTSIDITTTKEFNLQLDETPVILKKGSTVMNLMEVIKEWRDSMDQNSEWILDSQKSFNETYQLILNFKSTLQGEKKIEEKEIEKKTQPWYKRIFK